MTLPPGVSISQITPNIFVGNSASSTSIQALMHYGITSMVSLLSTTEAQLNEEAWSSPALDMLVPKANRLFMRCEDSPEEDLVGKLPTICDFIDEHVQHGHGGGGHGRRKSVEDVLKDILPASELPKGFDGGQQQSEEKPVQRVRSLIPDDDGNVEGLPPKQPAAAKGAEDMTELTRQKSSSSASGPAPQKQRVRSLIPDDVQPAAAGEPKPIPGVPSGSIPSVPSAPVPSVPGHGQMSSSHLSPQSQLFALSPSAQAGPSLSASASSSRPTTPTSPTGLEGSGENTGGKVLIHCNQGVSRSGAACVGYIMKQNPKWSVGHALRFVQLARKEVEPSENFMRQLKVWKECGFQVYEDGSAGEGSGLRPGEGLMAEGKSIDGKRAASASNGKGKDNKVPKPAYKKWLDEREAMRRRVQQMGGLVSPQGGGQV